MKGIEGLNIRDKLAKHAWCPNCNSRYSYSRRKTGDRVCRRCGTIYLVRPDGSATIIADGPPESKA